MNLTYDMKIKSKTTNYKNPQKTERQQQEYKIYKYDYIELFQRAAYR